MTRSEQERLVERYLSGEMLSADEEVFFMQVAVDRDLRQTLKAYRIVESALRKHRDNAPQHHDRTRARVVAMLGAQVPAHSANAAADAGGNATGSQAARAGRLVGRHVTVSTTVLKWIMGSVAALALTVGAFVVAPLLNPPSKPVAEQKAAITGVSAPATTNSNHPIESVTSSPVVAAPAPSGHPNTRTESTRRGAVPGASHLDISPRVSVRTDGMTGASPKGRKNSVKPRERDQQHDTASAQLGSSRETLPLKKNKSPRIIVRDSSLRVNVKVDLPK